MRPLTFNEIDSLWDIKSNLQPEDAPELIEKMEEAQPHIINYLLATGNDILKNSEREIVFYMGVIIWYIIDSLNDTIPELTLDHLFETENQNLKMLEYLAGEPDAEFMHTVQKIMEKYNQHDLLRYIIERIVDEPLENSDIDKNHIGMMVIYLKTLIDCIDSVI